MVRRGTARLAAESRPHRLALLVLAASVGRRVGRRGHDAVLARWKTRRSVTALRPFPRGATQRVACFWLRGRTAMTDKSPHETHSAKKSGKALKAKRTERKEKQDAAAQMQRLMHPRKQGG